MNMKHLYTSLDSGVTSGSVTDNSITDDSVIEIYFDNTDCYIDSTSQSGHTVYFTVGGNATGTNVCVVVNNLTNFTPYDDTNIDQRVTTLENSIDSIETEVDEISTLLDERVPEETVLGGVLYQGTTGNSWKKLDANSINYDTHSTLYSAMGDIDELETTSKNLVGAINEVKESGGGGGASVEFETTDYQYKAGSNQMFISANSYASFTIIPPTNENKKLINAYVKSVSNVPNWCKIMSIGVDITNNRINLLLKNDQNSNAYVSSSNTAWNLVLLWA